MKYYCGLDVSLQETFICIINQNGQMIKEAIVASDGDLISKYLLTQNLKYHKIGIESGQLSLYLCKALAANNLNVICVDARAMANALSARINKNDKNDAIGIAQMMRNNLYKEVKVKSDQSCEIKILLGSRRQLIRSRTQIIGTIRGLLKIHGIKISSKALFNKFAITVRDKLSTIKITKEENGLNTDKNNEINITAFAIESLLESLTQIESSLSKLGQEIIRQSKNDPEVSLLMTVPGVGEITAMTYKATLDEAERFKKSATVGAYLGLTPKQYSSGEVNRHGSISKMGPKECRSMLYEAAQSLLVNCKRNHKLKQWGLKIAKKKGRKKAIVALARKLAVIMHRMLITGQEFNYKMSVIKASDSKTKSLVASKKTAVIKKKASKK